MKSFTTLYLLFYNIGGDGTHGYDTSYGPAAFASNYWVNDWISMFTDNIKNQGVQDPLVLTRGVWAGGQRHGVVLWSSDVESSFQELTAQVNLGVRIKATQEQCSCNYR